MNKNSTLVNSLISGLVALAVGVLLLIIADDAVAITLRLIGIIMVVVGLIRATVEIVKNKNNFKKSVPWLSILFLVFGSTLLIWPVFWSKFVIVVFGILMGVMAVNLIITYIALRKSGNKVHWGLFIFPVLLLAAAVLAVIFPEFITFSLVVFIAIWLMLYGVVEIITYFVFKRNLIS